MTQYTLHDKPFLSPESFRHPAAINTFTANVRDGLKWLSFLISIILPQPIVQRALHMIVLVYLTYRQFYRT